MNWENIEGNWNDFHGKLIQQWSKLTSDDVNQVRGRRDALLGKLQERYGISRQLAENQIEDWMRRVESRPASALKRQTAFPSSISVGSAAYLMLSVNPSS